MKHLFTAILLLTLITSCTPTVTQTLASSSPTTITATPAAAGWWRDAVFYEIFVRSFSDSDGDGVGDFNGLARRLDYLQSLGVSALWLMPIHPSPSYHGYDVLDYYAVNPQYGTMDDFKRLLSEAHRRGMRVIIDLVLNHTSSQHPWFLDANNDPQSSRHSWYVWSDASQGRYWHPGSQGYYFGLFCNCMPDLNYNNPDVTAQMQKATRFWLDDIGVDGFRMDAIKHLIEEGDKIENTPATHAWLKGFYTFYKTDNPEAYAVGEVFDASAFIAKTYTGDQLDQVFNFEMASGFINSARGGGKSALEGALRFAERDLPSGEYATFLTNHDQDRVMDVLNNDVNKARVAAVLLLTSPGTPFIYYGEEIGMLGKKPDEDIRLPMQWTDDPVTAGFTDGKPWRAPAAITVSTNVAVQDKDANSLLNHYRALITLRNARPALRTGSLVLVETGNPAVYASLRSEANETLLILVNLGGKTITDYRLSSASAALLDGTYAPETLFGRGSAGTLIIDSNTFSNYKPLDKLPAYSTWVFHIKK